MVMTCLLFRGADRRQPGNHGFQNRPQFLVPAIIPIPGIEVYADGQFPFLPVIEGVGTQQLQEQGFRFRGVTGFKEVVSDGKKEILVLPGVQISEGTAQGHCPKDTGQSLLLPPQKPLTVGHVQVNPHQLPGGGAVFLSHGQKGFHIGKGQIGAFLPNESHQNRLDHFRVFLFFGSQQRQLAGSFLG